MERAEALTNLNANYAEYQKRLETGRLKQRNADESSALADYLASLEQPTQNAEGVHVGDLFYVEWGWEQTNVDFFQVVSLKGAHTAVLRKIRGDYIGGFSFSGKVRPKRNCFSNDKEYTVRTKKSPYYCDRGVTIKAPHLSGGQTMFKTTDDEEHDYTSYA